MKLSEINDLISSSSPFILLRTYDSFPERMPRHEIVTLERLISFSNARVVGPAAINHLDRYGPDEVALEDFNTTLATSQLVCRRNDRQGEIWDFGMCLRKYREFSKKWRKENVG